MSTGRVHGGSVRVDAAEKVTGAARYVSDVRLEGMLHAALARSRLPHARLRAVEVRPALQVAGVRASITGSDLRPLEDRGRPPGRDSYCLAVDRVRYVGEPLAAVAAETLEQARAGAEAVRAELEPLAAVDGLEQAADPSLPALHEGSPNLIWEWEYARGDPEAAWAQAERIFEGVYEYPINHHVALEPHACVADAGPGGVRLWTTTRNLYGVRQEIARLFGYRLADVEVVVPYVGGAYGSRSYCRLEPIAVALSLRAGRPVRLALSLAEDFAVAANHAVRIRLRTGVGCDGTLLAREVEVWVDTGAYADVGPLGQGVARHFAYRTPGPYRIPHLRVRAARAYTNKVPGTALRGYGAPQAAWAYEQHMDEIARGLGVDPVELRRRNLLAPGEPWYPGRLAADGRWAEVLDRAARAVGWEQLPAPGGGRGSAARGKGVAVALKNSGGVRTLAHALVRLHPDASATVLASCTESGQGARTALARIAARVLGLPVSAVRVVTPRSSLTPFDQITGSSGTTLVTGRAVQLAAEDVRHQLLELAGELWGVAPERLGLAGGAVHCPADGRHISIGELMRATLGPTGGELLGRGTCRRRLAAGDDPTLYYEFGAGAAEVQVDPETGAVRVVRYAAAVDVGHAIDPVQVEGQDEGGAVMGLGQALLEALVFEQGQPLNAGLATYRVPTFQDLPDELLTEAVENGDGPGPFGAKGAGEGALLPVAPAVASAIAHATGARLRRLPLWPETIWRAIRAGGPPA